MKSILGLFPLILIFGLACTHQEKPVNDSAFDTMSFKTEIVQSDGPNPYYYCEDFVLNALRFEYTVKSVDSAYKGFFKVTRDSVTNSHDKNQIDTVYTFVKNPNSIEIYRSPDADFLTRFDFTDPCFLLAGNIHTGVEKSFFVEKFHLSSLKQDTIEIGNLEGSYKFKFYFKNDKLERISFNGDLD